MHIGFVLVIIAAIIPVLLTSMPDPWVWALSLLWACLFGVLNYNHHSDRALIWSGLTRRDNVLVYTKLVDAMLRVLRRLLSPKDAITAQMPVKSLFTEIWNMRPPRARDPDDLKRLQASTFSWPVMDAALKIAVIYPLFLILIQWSITGQDTGIAEIPVLLKEERTWLRAVLVCPITALVITHTLASTTQKPVFIKASEWLFYLAGAGAVALTGADVGGSAGAVAIALVLAVAVAGAGTRAGTIAVALALVGTIAGAIALALAGGGAVEGAIAVKGALAVEGALAFAIVITVTLAVTLSGTGALSYGCAKGKGGRSYALFVTGLWTCLVITCAFSASSLIPEFRLLVFAIGLLPVINAVFDYLSYGSTIGLIRYGRSQRNLLTGLIWIIDGMVAVLLLIGLGLALSGTIALINHLGEQEFIALRPIFDGLKSPETRANYRWLTLTLLSTLVPTLVHLVLVFLSAFTWVPQHVKRWIAVSINDDHTGNLTTLGGSFAAATLGALWAGLVVFGLWGIWMFTTEYIEPVGLAILGIVENTTLWFGWVEA